MNAERIARALGWFSIGLGLSELAAPGRVSRLAGLDDRADALRACGVREVATGAAILANPTRPAWLWGRVLGDLIDLGMLRTALGGSGRQRRRGTIALAAVAGVTLLDFLASRRLSHRRREARRATTERHAAPPPLHGSEAFVATRSSIGNYGDESVEAIVR